MIFNRNSNPNDHKSTHPSNSLIHSFIPEIKEIHLPHSYRCAQCAQNARGQKLTLHPLSSEYLEQTGNRETDRWQGCAAKVPRCSRTRDAVIMWYVL